MSEWEWFGATIEAAKGLSVAIGLVAVGLVWIGFGLFSIARAIREAVK